MRFLFSIFLLFTTNWVYSQASYVYKSVDGVSKVSVIVAFKSESFNVGTKTDQGYSFNGSATFSSNKQNKMMRIIKGETVGHTDRCQRHFPTATFNLYENNIFKGKLVVTFSKDLKTLTGEWYSPDEEKMLDVYLELIKKTGDDGMDTYGI